MKLLGFIGPFLGLLHISFSLEGQLPEALVFNQGELSLSTDRGPSDGDNATSRFHNITKHKASIQDNGLTNKIQWLVDYNLVSKQMLKI